MKYDSRSLVSQTVGSSAGRVGVRSRLKARHAGGAIGQSGDLWWMKLDVQGESGDCLVGKERLLATTWRECL